MMTSDPHGPADRLADILERIGGAARLAGRNPADVTLIAISKTFDAPDIEPLIAAGQTRFGENRVQEAAGKWPELREDRPGLMLDMVGSLQSNKADDAVRLFDSIHSLDRPSLLKALGKAMKQQDRYLPCFIQVDIGEEEQKGGCAIADIAELKRAAEGDGIEIAGLMAIPPVDREPAPYFALLAKLAKDHGLAGLSMGMSGDFETAVQLGATHVRVGSALFGARD